MNLFFKALLIVGPNEFNEYDSPLPIRERIHWVLRVGLYLVKHRKQDKFIRVAFVTYIVRLERILYLLRHNEYHYLQWDTQNNDSSM